MDSDSMTTRAAAGSAHADDVVARLPYGVVVVEPGGLVSASNPCAQGYLPGLAQGEPTRCGELLDCMAPGGPCAEGCLAERAAQSEGALPEIRIDTRSAGGVSALWVTAAPLGRWPCACSTCGPGDARDRRRRSDPHWISGPRLRIAAFGRMHVDSPEGPLSGKWLQQRPGHVLKYLVCERNRVVHAEEIAEALWPGRGPDRPEQRAPLHPFAARQARAGPPEARAVVVHRGRPGRLRDRPPAGADRRGRLRGGREEGHRRPLAAARSPRRRPSWRRRSSSTAATSSPTSRTRSGPTPSATACAG